MLRSAVERQIEIIGEAARKVSDSFQQQHPEIPWTGIVGQRHPTSNLSYGTDQRPPSFLGVGEA